MSRTYCFITVLIVVASLGIVYIGKWPFSRHGFPLGDAHNPVTGALDAVAEMLDECPASVRGDQESTADSADYLHCAVLLYIWSEHMPLSAIARGIAAEVADSLNLPLRILSDADLDDTDEGARAKWSASANQLRAGLLAAGATIHFPALMLVSPRGIVGPAIVGYKSVDAYVSLISCRLVQYSDGPLDAHLSIVDDEFCADAHNDMGDSELVTKSFEWSMGGSFTQSNGQEMSTINIPMSMGAYFRYVPHLELLAFESGGQNRLLGLRSTEIFDAPGQIDLTPSPDGKLLVHPGLHDDGMSFYSAFAFAKPAAERSEHMAELFVDSLMTDQYPSVGVLESTESFSNVVRYRVMTSWLDRVAFRDYDAVLDIAGEIVSFVPVGDVRRPCPDSHISLPILSPGGWEFAGRDEISGTTKIFELSEQGTCRVLLDVGLSTGKISWNSNATKILFAVPHGSIIPMSASKGVVDSIAGGIFILDRRSRHFVGVPRTSGSRLLRFPAFLDGDSIVYAMAGGRSRDSTVLVVSCCY